MKNNFAFIPSPLIITVLEKLSIIIPCYNEEKLIGRVIDKVLQTPHGFDIGKEIIVVDDASTDNTPSILEAYAKDHPDIIFCRHNKNSGKGASIKTGLTKASGTIVVIQDADMEYDPKDFKKLLHPILDGFADVVYGSRFTGDGPHRVLFYFHTIGNKFLTMLSNLFTQLNLTDMETGYKMFRIEVLHKISLKEKRFGFEPEVTAKISRVKGIRIYEAGIAYYGRTYKEGKKINWKDGFKAIYCIIKYNLFSRK